MAPWAGEVWGQRATDWLRCRVLGRDLVTLVKGYRGDVMEVVLVDTSGEQDRDVATEMVSRGLARSV